MPGAVPSAIPTAIDGMPFPSKTKAARALGFRQGCSVDAALRRAQKQGISVIEAAAQTPRLKPVRVAGTEFRSANQAARAFGVPSSTLYGRIEDGLPLAKALTARPAHEVTLATGETFPSLKALAQSLGVGEKLLSKKRDELGTLEMAVLALRREKPVRYAVPRPVTLFGRKFRSMEQAGKAVGLSRHVFADALETAARRGVPLEVVVRELRENPPGVWVQGVHYGTLKEACQAYGVPYKQAHARISRGLSVELALLTPANPNKVQNCGPRKDKNLVVFGVRYSSVTAASHALGMNPKTAAKRLRAGIPADVVFAAKKGERRVGAPIEMRS